LLAEKDEVGNTHEIIFEEAQLNFNYDHYDEKSKSLIIRAEIGNRYGNTVTRVAYPAG